MNLKLSFTLRWGKDIWMADGNKFAGSVSYDVFEELFILISDICDLTSAIFPYI